ncbi:type VI secretion system Vgr family protein [Cupriavidus plantarum]|uniref:type VI secretion system Vgr family protein n=1 Tax=Cupriavidus plantarum TaxID=942865 RepID=UPI000EB24A49|nr:type VI secretion system Vgr family protein [Cupriavidus plantarum]RLK31665.1 Rhs element Vgr protein [Cupriavidus plantarum]
MGGLSDMTNQLGALMRSAFTQQDRLLRLKTPLGEDVLLAESMVAREHVDDGGFRIELTALSDDAAIDPAALLGQPVRVDLLTQQSRTTLRPLHGYVTRFERLGANGGLARYRLVIEPWLAFLRHRRDSYLFQDMSVIEVLDSVFGDYRGQGVLAPEWRWDLAEREAYSRRSVVTQYEESDYAFATRLLAEEGLFYYFEHEAGDGDALGVHRMVIADSNRNFTDNAQATIRFGRNDATAQEDAIDQWHGERQLQTNAVEFASWDYRAASTHAAARESARDNGKGAIALRDSDYLGQYWFEDGDQAARVARIAMESLELRNKQFHGGGSVRTLAPATCFTLQDHYEHDGDGSDQDRRFAVLAVTHTARNNFNERFGEALRAALGGRDGSNAEAEIPFYRNTFVTVRASVPYRPALRGEDGRLLHPRPTVLGSQTAIVVGSDDPLHTDRDHRVKVQFHWQRGGNSATRQGHPAGDDNARANAGLGAWVRVATAVAGDNWGGVALPRVGQEVVVEFVHGDIDRPVIVGATYNGAGSVDAQANQQAAGSAKSTGNAPAWFAGEGKDKEAYAHNAVLSGIKTQAMAGSQKGSDGFNQLVFDDTEGQSRTELSTTQAGTGLLLGHHKAQNDNARNDDLGHGAALYTAAAGSVRAGAGLLLSAHPASVTQPFLHGDDAVQQVEQARQRVEALADLAAKQKAAGDSEPRAAEIPAIAALKHSVEVLGAEQGSDSKATAYSEPHLLMTAPDGVAVSTPGDATLVAGQHAMLTAGTDVNLAVGKTLAIAVADGIDLFTDGQGGENAAGLQMHAANGKVVVASLNGVGRYAADKTVTIASAQGQTLAQAKQEITMKAAGAQLRVLDGRIELYAPGKVEFKGGQHNFVGPAGATASSAQPDGALQLCQFKARGADATGAALIELG